MPSNTQLTILGTGKLGSALAARFASADCRVFLGSRSADKAKQVAADLNTRVGNENVTGAANFDAAMSTDICILAVPYQAQLTVLEPLKMILYRKIMVTPVAALDSKDPTRVSLPRGGTSAVEAQEFVGPKVKVVSAFQTIMYRNLLDLDEPVACDTFVAGNHAGAKQEVIDLLKLITVRAWDIGPLENTAAAEAFTPILIYLNNQHEVKTAGLRVTGIPG